MDEHTARTWAERIAIRLDTVTDAVAATTDGSEWGVRVYQQTARGVRLAHWLMTAEECESLQTV